MSVHKETLICEYKDDQTDSLFLECSANVYTIGFIFFQKQHSIFYEICFVSTHIFPNKNLRCVTDKRMSGDQAGS